MMERAEASRRTIAFRLGAAAFMIAALIQAGAQNASAQQASSQRAGGAIAGAENNDEDFTRPENLIQLRFLYETAPGSGSLPGTIRTVTTGRQVLRTDTKVDVAPEWSLALRGDLPFSEKDPISSENPSGQFVEGLGDADVQAALIKTLNARWAAGAGLRIVAPTGASDITSGKWQALPIIGARTMLPELSEGSFFTGLFRYDVSFAGDPSKKNISNLQIAPTLNIMLPQALVRDVLSRSRHPHQFWRSGHRADRPLVPADGRSDRARPDQESHAVIGDQHPHNQGLSGLRF